MGLVPAVPGPCSPTSGTSLSLGFPIWDTGTVASACQGDRGRWRAWRAPGCETARPGAGPRRVPASPSERARVWSLPGPATRLACAPVSHGDSAQPEKQWAGLLLLGPWPEPGGKGGRWPGHRTDLVPLATSGEHGSPIPTGEAVLASALRGVAAPTFQCHLAGDGGGQQPPHWGADRIPGVPRPPP